VQRGAVCFWFFFLNKASVGFCMRLGSSFFVLKSLIKANTIRLNHLLKRFLKLPDLLVGERLQCTFRFMEKEEDSELSVH
jgi:hypothetical protein